MESSMRNPYPYKAFPQTKEEKRNNYRHEKWEADQKKADQRAEEAQDRADQRERDRQNFEASERIKAREERRQEEKERREYEEEKERRIEARREEEVQRQREETTKKRIKYIEEKFYFYEAQGWLSLSFEEMVQKELELYAKDPYSNLITNGIRWDRYASKSDIVIIEKNYSLHTIEKVILEADKRIRCAINQHKKFIERIQNGEEKEKRYQKEYKEEKEKIKEKKEREEVELEIEINEWLDRGKYLLINEVMSDETLEMRCL